jgi:hypothetical protein
MLTLKIKEPLKITSEVVVKLPKRLTFASYK